MPWTRFFSSAAEVGGPQLNDVMEGLSRLFEGMGEEEVFRVACREMKRILRCDEVSLFLHVPQPASLYDGDWALRVVGGEGIGAMVRQLDASAAPELAVGVPVGYSEQAAHQALLKTIALAFERAEFMGCDVERGRVVLLADPGPEDDLGSGKLSLLALPLTYHHRVGHLVERARVGVLALYGLPVACDLRELERFLRSLLGYAITTPACSLRDPVTGLYSAAHLEAELERYLNVYELTKHKLNGGLVVGQIDALGRIRQALAAEGRIPPAALEQRASEILRTVGACLTRQTQDYELTSTTYRCGVPARLGPVSFAALLPLLDAEQLAQWCRRLASSAGALQVPSAGSDSAPLTLSLRALPFGLPQTTRSASVWELVRACLERFEPERARAEPSLGARPAVQGDHQVWTSAGWKPLGGR